jgi:hypothetical protein
VSIASIAPVREPSFPVPVVVPPMEPAPAPADGSPSSHPPAGDPSPFARLLHGLGSEVQRGETLVRGAVASASGGELSTASLIALQAGVYRYSEVVDLAARLVDHATTALKTVVQNQ